MARNPAAVGTPRPSAISIAPSTLLMFLLLGVVGFLVLTPLLLTLVNSFQLGRPGQEPTYGFDGWIRAFSDPSILSALWNSLSLAVVRQAIATVVGGFLALEGGARIQGLDIVLSPLAAGRAGVDPAARRQIRLGESVAGGVAVRGRAYFQCLFLLGDRVGPFDDLPGCQGAPACPGVS